MAEIIKIYKEHFPALRFIGKCYTDVDRINGDFTHKWNDWFTYLEKIDKVENIENGYIGFMRCYPNFEYWIGIFLPPNTAVPNDYDCIDLTEGDIGVCWIKGKSEDGSIYNMHAQCLQKLSEHGMGKYRTGNDGRAYFFERYNCPRFLDKDEHGNVILDYGIYLEA